MPVKLLIQAMFSRLNLTFKNYREIVSWKLGIENIWPPPVPEIPFSEAESQILWQWKWMELFHWWEELRKQEMQTSYGAQGSLAGFVYIMISMCNTSLILVPFPLLCEVAGPCTCQPAESKKAVSETHRTQACVLHISPALWLVIFQFFTIMSSTEVSKQLTSQASLKHVPALNFKLSLFSSITVSMKSILAIQADFSSLLLLIIFNV